MRLLFLLIFFEIVSFYGEMFVMFYVSLSPLSDPSFIGTEPSRQVVECIEMMKTLAAFSVRSARLTILTLRLLLVYDSCL